jgi:hypothetical protein
MCPREDQPTVQSKFRSEQSGSYSRQSTKQSAAHRWISPPRSSARFSPKRRSVTGILACMGTPVHTRGRGSHKSFSSPSCTVKAPVLMVLGGFVTAREGPKPVHSTMISRVRSVSPQYDPCRLNTTLGRALADLPEILFGILGILFRVTLDACVVCLGRSFGLK